MKILITGIAGFIGYHTTKKALDLDFEVVGIDNLNDYYEVELKEARLEQLGINPGQEKSSKYINKLRFYKLDLCDDKAISHLFQSENFDYVIHLAAQAGVRYSLENPRVYTKSNVDGFLNILEGCRQSKVKHLIFASSSSVYGSHASIPFKTQDPVDHPVSLYAATKRANELMAHSYSHLYGIPTTGLRYFTVYGPWGRPDMAPFLFTKAIIEGKPIKVFNNGNMERDFTYVDDIVEAQMRLLEVIPSSQDRSAPNRSSALFQIYNIGNSNPVKLLNFIELIEENLKIKAKKDMLPMQAGDVPRTYADVEDIYSKINFKPTTELKVGIKKFIDWYKSYYEV